MALIGEGEASLNALTDFFGHKDTENEWIEIWAVVHIKEQSADPSEKNIK